MYSHPSKKHLPAASSQVAVAACTVEIKSTGELQLTPAGIFKARDGRPFEVDGWRVTDTTAPTVLAALKSHKDKIVIDYEHATLYTEKTGKPALAAGWFRGDDVEYRTGEGFFVTPTWTAAAKAYIEAEELKYFSPVIKYNKKTGDVLDILMGALTNYAAIEGMKEVEALAAAKFDINQSQSQQENPMLEFLIAMLGLEQGASEDEVKAALKAVFDANKNAQEAIAAAKAETPADAMEAITALRTELKELKTGLIDDEVTDLVTAALKSGVLLEGEKNWAVNLGKQNLELLKEHLQHAEPLAALKGNQTRGKKPEGAEAEALDETALAVCKQMGINPDDYKKTLAEQETI